MGSELSSWQPITKMGNFKLQIVKYTYRNIPLCLIVAKTQIFFFSCYMIILNLVRYPGGQHSFILFYTNPLLILWLIILFVFFWFPRLWCRRIECVSHGFRESSLLWPGATERTGRGSAESSWGHFHPWLWAWRPLQTSPVPPVHRLLLVCSGGHGTTHSWNIHQVIQVAIQWLVLRCLCQ